MPGGMRLTLASGERVWRPMGLTDVPGGACMAGLYAFLFGVGFFLSERSDWLRAAALGSMLIGLCCVYLCQVRSVLVMAVVCSVVLLGVLMQRRDMARVLRLGAVLATVFFLS